MNTAHPKKNDKPERHGPIPHDPRDEPLPTGKPDEKSRSREEAEEEARREEGVDMKQKERDIPKELSEDAVIVNPTADDELPTGIQTGQTTGDLHGYQHWRTLCGPPGRKVRYSGCSPTRERQTVEPDCRP